ncbi:MAG: hypothetical protein ACHQJ4_05350, partial [Ignavibacteria bacterium]
INLKKYFLVALKASGIFLLLVLFIEPSFISGTFSKLENINLVLVDNSRSNNLPSKENQTKASQVRSILNSGSDFFKGTKGFTFSSGGAEPLNFASADSISFDGFETNLTSALPSVMTGFSTDNINTVTIISDGNFNAGGNPLYKLKELNCPVFTIGIGDTVQHKDFVIDKTLYNDKAFINTNNIIKVFISAFGYNNENIPVNIKREGTIIATKNFIVDNAAKSGEIDFDITESKPGYVKYTIEAGNLPGEITYANNKTDILIKYLDDKVNLLYISSGPGYDNSFIGSMLKRVKNYHVISHVLKSPNDFFEGNIDYNKFGDLSLIFLLGFPSFQTNKELANNILSKSREYKIPIIFFAQKSSDYKLLSDYIPVSASNSSQENIVALKSTLASSGYDFLKGLDNSPQIFRNVNGITPKAGSDVLASDKSSGEPVLVEGTENSVNSLAFLCYGTWKWELNDKQDNEKFTENFLTGIINRTLSKDKKDKLTLSPAKNIFDYTENVLVNAEALDENSRPTNNLTIKGELYKNNQKVKDCDFSFVNNSYSSNLYRLPAGDYVLDAKAYKENNIYAESSVRFLVDTINTEYLITKSNIDALKIISQNTGGGFFSGNDTFDSYRDKIISAKKQSSPAELTYIKFNLWENKFILILIILLFSAEWVFRKRNNLP